MWNKNRLRSLTAIVIVILALLSAKDITTHANTLHFSYHPQTTQITQTTQVNNTNPNQMPNFSKLALDAETPPLFAGYNSKYAEVAFKQGMQNGNGQPINKYYADNKFNNPIITTNLIHNINYRLGWEYRFITNASAQDDNELSDSAYRQANHNYHRATKFHTHHPNKNYTMKTGISVIPILKHHQAPYLHIYHLPNYANLRSLAHRYDKLDYLDYDENDNIDNKSVSHFDTGFDDGDYTGQYELKFETKLANSKYYHLGWIYSVACDDMPRYNSFDDVDNSRKIIRIPKAQLKQANQLYNKIVRRINHHNYHYFVHQHTVIVHFKKAPYYQNNKYNRKYHCRELAAQWAQKIYDQYSQADPTTKNKCAKGIKDSKNSQSPQYFVNIKLAQDPAYKNGWFANYIFNNIFAYKSKDNPIKYIKRTYHTVYKHGGYLDIDE